MAIDPRRAELLNEELAILGCALNSEGRSLVAMVESYVPEAQAFVEPVSRALWLGMREVALNDGGPQAINPATVEQALVRLNCLDLLAGEGLPGRTPHQLVLDAYVAAVESRPSLEPDALQSACRVVQGRFGATRLYQVCASYAAQARQPGSEVAHLVAGLQGELATLLSGATHLDEKMVSLDQAILKTLDAMKEVKAQKNPVVGLPTGFQDIDKQFGGMRPGRMVILGGGYKDGKSVIGQTVALHVALNCDLPVLYFSYEMDDKEIAERFFSQIYHIPPDAVRWATVEKIDGMAFAAFDQAVRAPKPGSLLAESLRRWQNFIYVDATPMTVAEIEGAIRHTNWQMQQQGRPPVALVVVDYIQLMTGRRASNYGNRQDMVYADISRDLKQMARQLKLPVFALSQLSAAGDGTTAAGSRMLEANADNYWTIHQKLPGEDFGMFYLKRNRNARNRLAFKVLLDFDRLSYRLVDTIHEDPDELLRGRAPGEEGGSGKASYNGERRSNGGERRVNGGERRQEKKPEKKRAGWEEVPTGPAPYDPFADSEAG